MNKIKRQNKKRNSVLLYEVLISHISRCLLDDNQKEANKTLEISKKFFSEGMPLRNELKLFQTVLSSRSVSRDAMTKIVDSVCRSAGYMNPRVLDEHKSKLIKEINYNLTDKVYNYKIPDFINYSSLQMLFNESRNKNKKLDEVLKIKIKDSLITRLVENRTGSKEVANSSQSNNSVYKTLVRNFNQKYANSLTENQKKFLIQYAASLMTGDKKEFDRFIKNENFRILSSLREVKDPEILKDKELMNKLNECTKKYEETVSCQSSSDEKILMEFLQFISLVDEMVT